MQCRGLIIKMCTIFIVTVHRIVDDSVTDKLLQCTGLIVTVNIVY